MMCAFLFVAYELWWIMPHAEYKNSLSLIAYNNKENMPFHDFTHSVAFDHQKGTVVGI